MQTKLENALENLFYLAEYTTILVLILTFFLKIILKLKLFQYRN